MKNLIFDSEDENGIIDYSLSIFGEIDYMRTDTVELLLPGNINSFGCNNLYSRYFFSKGKYAFLLEEGGCPLSKKGMNTKFAGGLYSFVFSAYKDKQADDEGFVYKQQ